MKKAIAGILAVFAAASPAAAQAPDLIGAYGSWEAYSYTADSGKVCFMSAAPDTQSSSVPSARRGEARVFITHWAGEGARNVISLQAGYPLRAKSVSFAIDGKTFQLFSEGEKAWSAGEDDAIAAALSKGSVLTVKGTSTRGTETKDTYSLKGSGEAYKATRKACGI